MDSKSRNVHLSVHVSLSSQFDSFDLVIVVIHTFTIFNHPYQRLFYDPIAHMGVHIYIWFKNSSDQGHKYNGKLWNILAV